MVGKSILKRRFSPIGTEGEPAGFYPATGGCDVEVVNILADGMTAWSFALAAFGPTMEGPANIMTAWRSVCASVSPPASLTNGLGMACGYPTWLAAHVADWQP